MQSSSPIIALLVTLLIVLNGKAILNYLEWLRFKIKVYFKQLEKNNHNQHINYKN